MTFEVKVGMKLQDVKAYVEKQDYMSKEQKIKIFNFIKDDTDGIVTHSTEKALLSSLLNGHSGAIFKGLNINEKNSKNTRVEGDKDRHSTIIKQSGLPYEEVSLTIDRTRGKEERTLEYRGEHFDEFYLDKNGKITGRLTSGDGSTYYSDNDCDGIYDYKSVFVGDEDNRAMQNYYRDKDGNWQMDM